MQRDITDEVGKCRAMNNLITPHSCTASGQKKNRKQKSNIIQHVVHMYIHA